MDSGIQEQYSAMIIYSSKEVREDLPEVFLQSGPKEWEGVTWGRTF